jgi:hypothetical protein
VVSLCLLSTELIVFLDFGCEDLVILVDCTHCCGLIRSLSLILISVLQRYVDDVLVYVFLLHLQRQGMLLISVGHPLDFFLAPQLYGAPFIALRYQMRVFRSLVVNP